MDVDVRRREFIKSAFLGANGLFLTGGKLDFFKKGQISKINGIASSSLSVLVYENDFSENLDGITSHAALNLRLENRQLRFSSTNVGRGIYVGPTYPQAGKQYVLVIKLNNVGLSGLRVYRNRADTNSLVETIISTNEMLIPFTSESNNVNNRLFLSTAGPEFDLSIDYIKIYEAIPEEEDLWVGTYRQRVNGRLYTWIPSREVTILPQSNGSVVLKAPFSKSSVLGGNTCNRFVYDENYRRLGSNFLNELFGGGVNLPDGHYHFLIHYFNAPSYDAVDAEPWRMAGNLATYQYNSAHPEAISFSVETLGSGSQPNKVAVPATQERVSWVVSNQYLSENLKLPEGKAFGITNMHWDVVPTDKAANVNEVLKKVTQIQLAGRVELFSISPDRLWDCILGTGLSAWQIAYGYRLTPRFSVMGQMKEQGLSNQELEEAFKLMYRRLQNEYGVNNPNQTRLFEDYFAATDGFGTGAVFNNDPRRYEDKKRQLSSRTEAMKQYGLESIYGVNPTSQYFSHDAYSYRNRGASGYLDSYQRIPNGIMLYRLIFEYEKSYLSANDRQVMCMSWAESEGVNSETTRYGIKYRLKLSKGDLIRTQLVGLPFEMLKNQCFFALLLGTSFSLWNETANLVKDIASWYPHTRGGNVEFHESGTNNPVTWNINNPNHPKPVASKILVSYRGTSFPNAPQIGEQGAWVGAYLYSQISTASDRISQSMQYASHSYRINDGATQSGYQNGNDPVKGKMGNAEISRMGFVNEGQYNIVDLWEFQKPVVIVTKGSNGFSVIIKNVICEPTDKIVYSVQVNGSTRDITHIGRSLGIYLFS